MSEINKLQDETDEEEKIRKDKFTRNYDPEYAKANLDIAPCNIWAYIKELEERVALLENKILELEKKIGV